jgi:hypothetical protein
MAKGAIVREIGRKKRALSRVSQESVGVYRDGAFDSRESDQIRLRGLWDIHGLILELCLERQPCSPSGHREAPSSLAYMASSITEAWAQAEVAGSACPLWPARIRAFSSPNGSVARITSIERISDATNTSNAPV